MAKATSGRLTSVEQLDTVVDTDAHVMESVEDLIPYIDDRFAGSRKIIKAAKRPLNDIYSVSHSTPPFPFVENEYEDGPEMDYGEMEYSSDEKLEEMTDFDIDYGLLDATLNLGLATVENRQLAVALANAYNSWLLDQYLDRKEEFIGTILVPPQKPDAAAEEIDRWADEDDMVGVYIPTTGVLPPLGHEMYDPIYEAAASHDLPIAMHGGNLATMHSFPTQRRWNEYYAETHLITHPFGHIWNLTTMFTRGIPERFPNLDFLIQESGIAWVPYFEWRIDDHYLELPHEFSLSELPSEYLRENFYFTTQPLGHTAHDRQHLAKAIELIGPERITYASDLPHTDFDPPEELFNRVNGYFDEETVKGMMGETAAELFSL